MQDLKPIGLLFDAGSETNRPIVWCRIWNQQAHCLMQDLTKSTTLPLGSMCVKIVSGFGRRALRSSMALLSVVGAIGRAGLRKEVGLLRPGPRGPKVLRHQMVRWCAGGKEYSRWFFKLVNFLKLTKYQYAMFTFAFSFVMTSGFSIITLRRAQKFGDSEP